MSFLYHHLGTIPKTPRKLAYGPVYKGMLELYPKFPRLSLDHTNGLAEDCSTSGALDMQRRGFYTKPSISYPISKDTTNSSHTIRTGKYNHINMIPQIKLKDIIGLFK